MTSQQAITTKEILDKLKAFTNQAWKSEPQDITNLRKFALPPMGNLPCVLYANFNTFWTGENVQVHRQLAIDKKVGLKDLQVTIAAILTRHIGRLSKWQMKETVALLQQLVHFFDNGGAQTYEDYIQIMEAIMVAIDRVNSWIDAIIPWNDLDQKLALRTPLA